MRIAGHGSLVCVGRDGLGRMDIRSPKMKKRNRRCDPGKQRYWEEIVRKWKDSGQSVRGYCRAEGVREPSFYFWRRELARRGPLPGATDPELPAAFDSVRASPGPKRRPLPGRGSASFLPVRIVEDAPAEATCGVEIVLACGRRVRVPAGFDRQTLVNVLAVLEVRPC
jgi:hypothetical protein